MTKMAEMTNYSCANDKGNNSETKDLHEDTGVKIKEEVEDVVEIFAEDIVDFAGLDQLDSQEDLHNFLPSHSPDPTNESIVTKPRNTKNEVSEIEENTSQTTESQKQAQNIKERSIKETTFENDKECLLEKNKSKSAIFNEHPSTLPQNDCSTLRALLEKQSFEPPENAGFMSKANSLFNKVTNSSNKETKESLEEEPAVKIRFTDSGMEWIYKSKPETLKNAHLTKTDINIKKHIDSNNAKPKNSPQKRSLPPLVPLQPKNVLKLVPSPDLKNSPNKLSTTSDSDIESDFEDKSSTKVRDKVKQFLMNKFLRSTEEFMPKDDVVVISDSEDEEIPNNNAQIETTQDTSKKSPKQSKESKKTDNIETTVKETLTATNFESITKDMPVTVRYIPESHQIILENHSNKSINISGQALSSVLSGNIKNGIDIATRKSVDNFANSSTSVAKVAQNSQGTDVESNVIVSKSEQNRKVENEISIVGTKNVSPKVTKKSAISISLKIKPPQQEFLPGVRNYYITEKPLPKLKLISKNTDLNLTKAPKGPVSANEEKSVSDSDEGNLVISEDAEEKTEAKLKQNEEELKRNMATKYLVPNKKPISPAQRLKIYKEAVLKPQTTKVKIFKCTVPECQFKVGQTPNKNSWRDAIWIHYTKKHHSDSESALCGGPRSNGHLISVDRLLRTLLGQCDTLAKPTSKVLTCEDKLCPQTFECKRSQFIHVVEYHHSYDTLTDVLCPICTFGSPTLLLVSNHFQLHGVFNSETGFTRCGLCGFMFNSKTRSRHLLYHNRKIEKDRAKKFFEELVSKQAKVDPKIVNQTDKQEVFEIKELEFTNQTENKAEIETSAHETEKQKEEQIEVIEDRQNTPQKHIPFTEQICKQKSERKNKFLEHAHSNNIKKMQTKTITESRNEADSIKEFKLLDKTEEHIEENSTNLKSHQQNSYNGTKPDFADVVTKKNQKLKSNGLNKGHNIKTLKTNKPHLNSKGVLPKKIEKLKNNGPSKGPNISTLTNKQHLNGGSIFKKEHVNARISLDSEKIAKLNTPSGTTTDIVKDLTLPMGKISTQNGYEVDLFPVVKANQSTKSGHSRKLLKRSSTDDFMELKCKRKLIKATDKLNNLKYNKVGVPYHS